MSGITTHVLDTVLGRPAAGIAVHLERQENAIWSEIAVSVTDADGRCRNLLLQTLSGIYRIRFETGDYFRNQARTSIYPEVMITFEAHGEEHYHLPLLLSDNSYTTYRGS